MPDVLMYADTFRSPELRHEVPLGVPDPFLYVERDGVKHIVDRLDGDPAPRGARAASSCTRCEEFGLDELIAAGHARYAEIARRDRRCARSQALGVTSARRARRRSRCWLADQLRADGVELTRRPRVLRRPPPREDGRASSPGSAARSAPPRRGWTRRATCCAGRARTATALALDGEPLTVERVKAAMRAGLRRARRDAPTTSSSRPAPQGAVGHDMGSGPIRAGVPIVIDIWPRDNESFVLLRHDAHVRRRRGPGRRARVAPPLQGGARPRDLRDQGRRRRTRRSSTAPARSSRRPASRRSARRTPASRSRTGSSTGSATASGSRCTRQPGLGLAVEDAARGRRRRHRRAGPLPAGLRRRAARGSRARHRGRRREPDGVPVRPRAVSASQDDRHALPRGAAVSAARRRSPRRRTRSRRSTTRTSRRSGSARAASASRGSSRSRSSTSGSRRTRSGTSAAS